MKKLLWFVIVLLLISILYFRYKDYTKYNPPTYFNYTLNEAIDINYHNPIVVKEYFENAYKIGGFARQLWANKGVNINFISSENPDFINSYSYYQSLVINTQIIERKLVLSGELKEKGFSNKEIESIEKEGVNPKKIEKEKAYNNLLQLNNLTSGDIGQEVWQLQKQLISMGYKIPKDGLFGKETLIAIIDLQKKNDLYPSGEIDLATIKALIK